MIKFFKGILGVLVLTLLFLLIAIHNKETYHYYTQELDSTPTVHQTYVDDSQFIPGYGKSYIGFKENLAYKESRGKYHIINTLGYMGKYQFGTTTLAALKIKDTETFMNNPKIQEKAFRANLSRNKWLLQDEIKKYSGRIINGVEITESGILAAAHLAGVGNVKKFLSSNGKKRSKDAFGTRIEHYIRDFANYDLSVIEPSSNPKL